MGGLLPDGSEKGLKGHFKEDFSHRTRVGLAPPAGVIDRNVPYKRIATEEAWTFPELVKAQVDYLESGDAPDDDSLRMAGMFSKMPSLQEMLQDLGELRLAHMDEFGIDRQLLLLTAPGVQVVRPGEGTPLARLANDIAAEACRRHPDRFSACAAFDPRDVAGSVKERKMSSRLLPWFCSMPRSSSSVPSTSFLPLVTMITRSQSFSAVSSRWVEMRMQAPLSRARAISCFNSFAPSGSIPIKGSSKSMTLAL